MIALDSSFGHDGFVGPTTTGVQGLTFPDVGLVRSHTGTLLAAGTGQQPDGEHFYLAAYTSQGEVDTDFGDAGVVVSEIFANGSALTVQPVPGVGPEREVWAREMVLIGGQTNDPESGNNVFALQRYNLRGRLDPTFGRDGTVRLDVAPLSGPADEDDEMLTSVAVQAGAGILGAGYVAKANGSRGALVRWHLDGRLDVGFGGYGSGAPGRVIYPALDAPTDLWGNVPDTAFQSIGLQSNGRIVVGGTYGGQLLVARFTEDGAFDPSFGENGRVTLTIGLGWATGPRVLVQPDDRIVVVATVGSPTGDGEDGDVTAVGLARLLPEGDLDPTFGQLVRRPFGPPPHRNGATTYRLGWSIENIPGTGFEGVSDALILPGARESILGVGGTSALAAFQGDFLITRYLADGDVDRVATGPAGAVETAVPQGGGQATACVLDPDGRTVTVAGGVSGGDGTGIGLARYLL